MSRIEEVIDQPTEGLPDQPTEGLPDQPTEGLPPGLRWPRAAQTAAWAVRPYYVMRYGRRRFGDVFSVRLYGFGDMMVVGDPAVMKEIFTGDREVFAAGRA